MGQQLFLFGFPLLCQVLKILLEGYLKLVLWVEKPRKGILIKTFALSHFRFLFFTYIKGIYLPVHEEHQTVLTRIPG